MKLIIHAPNVHEGGGKTLLLALLHAAQHRKDVVAILDTRLALPPASSGSITILSTAASVPGRLIAEWQLRRLADDGAVVLCMGNLPPLLGARGRIAVFVQNRLLIGSNDLSGFPVRTRIRIGLEKLWLHSRLAGGHMVIVQTPTMCRDFERSFGRRPLVAPFAERVSDDSPSAIGASASGKAEFDFLYVASGEPHKNHVNLISAWKLLGEEGLHPSLCLTVAPDRYPEVCAKIDEARTELKLEIRNMGSLASDEIRLLYRRSSALIYPSLLESFGLPLVEARQAGLSIIASELDYVRDLVNPAETFDPRSPVSIARAVKRFLAAEGQLPSIVNAEQFIDRLLSDSFSRK